MIKTFISDIGSKQFLEQANNTIAVLEIAKFYEIKLTCEEDIMKLYKAMEQNYFHQEAFVYGIYFAAWIKSEVHGSKCVFKKYDE